MIDKQLINQYNEIRGIKQKHNKFVNDIKTTNKNVVYIAVIEGTQEKTYKINYYYGYDFDNSGKVNDACDLIYSQNLKENETIVWKEFKHSYKKNNCFANHS